MVAPWVIGGRRRTSQLSVRREVAGRFVPAVVILALLGLAGVTVLAVIAIAHHVSHPVTVASSAVAVILVLGGPRALAVIRRRAQTLRAAS